MGWFRVVGKLEFDVVDVDFVRLFFMGFLLINRFSHGCKHWVDHL
jgi:hypothetical protein